MENLCFLLLKIPPDNATKEDASAEFFSQVAEILKGQKVTISLEIIIYGKYLWFFLVCPLGVKDTIRGQWYSQYPHAQVEEVKDFVQKILSVSSPLVFAGRELYYDQPDNLPLKTYKELQKNPLASLAGISNSFEAGEVGIIQLILQAPQKDNFVEKIFKKLGEGERKKYSDEKMQKPEYVLLEENKEEGPYFITTLRFLTGGIHKEKVLLNLSTMIAIYKKNLERPKIQKLKEDSIRNDSNFVNQIIERVTGKHKARFSPDEIATIFHLPYKEEGISQISQMSAKTAPAPENIPDDIENDNTIAVFGETNYQNKNSAFGLKTSDRRRHLYIVGKTGVGKSKLIELLIKSDLENGRGVVLLDPHGDLSQEVLALVPSSRKHEVVYFNPADAEYPVGFNPMEGVSTFEFKQNVVAGFISIFKKLFGFNWNERLEHVLRYTTLALLDYPASNILGITRMLSDNQFRQEVIQYISDPQVKKFWTTEFASWNEQFAQQAIAPIINNVGQFIANPIIRHIVGQSKTGFSLGDILNGKKIFIANLSIGKLGEENSALLGSMLITKIWQTAMARASVNEEDRKDVFMYVDEFQNFATSAFANIFSEARKYRLNLTVSHQYMQQLPSEVRSTIFGNVGSIVSFRVGGEDAQILAKEFEPVFATGDFLNLDSRNFYIKMSVDGITARPFSGNTITLKTPPDNFRNEIIENSRKKYSKREKGVAEEIEKWERGEILLKKKDKKEESLFPEPII